MLSVQRFIISFLLLGLTLSQYQPYAMIKTDYANLYSTAVSPYNGDIMVGGDGVLARYDSEGYYKDSYNGHTGRVIALFWTNDFLVSIDETGNVVKHDPIFLTYMGSITLGQNIMNADLSYAHLAVNYGNSIQEYLIKTFELVYTYLPKYGGFRGMAYSQHDKGSYLYVLQQGHRDVWNVKTRSYTSYTSLNSYSSIYTSPYHDEQVLVNNNLKIEKWQRTGYIETFEDYAMLAAAKYSFDGSYVISAYLSSQLMIWENREAVELVQGWTCSITGINSNKGILSVIDSCGELGILKSEDYIEFPIWVVLIVAVVVIVAVCAFIVFLIRKSRAARRMQMGGYQQPSVPIGQPINNNPYGVIENQGWNNQGNQGWNNNQRNQGFNNNQENQGWNNNANQGYQPPRNW